MTPEARLDRLERIAKLFVRAGLRYRRDLRALGDKIDIIVTAQIKNEERFALNEERFARFEARVEMLFEKSDFRFAQLAEFQANTDRRFAQLAEFQANTDRRFAQLADSQANTDRRLNSLIDLIRRGQNGDGAQNN